MRAHFGSSRGTSVAVSACIAPPFAFLCSVAVSAIMVRRVRLRRHVRPWEYSDELNVRDDHATWEYFEKGGWKAMDERTNNILEMAYCDGDEECDEEWVLREPWNLATWNYAKYIWNFADLTQKRFHWAWDGFDWACVKTRSIRRVQVLSAPANPRG